jgi:DNA polymerase-3 subunit alpha
MERLNIEKELIGFYFSGHPLDDYRSAWEKLVKLDLSDVEKAPEREYTLIGILKTLKPHTNKSGKTMAFASLSDFRGEIDLVFFEKIWESCRDRITAGDTIALKGRLNKQRGSPCLQVDSILDSQRIKIKEDLFEYGASEGGGRSSGVAADGTVGAGSAGHHPPANFAEDLTPLDNYKEAWEKLVTLDLSKPEQGAEGEHTLIGILTRLKPIVTKNGKDMAFAILSDYRGEMDMVFFPSAWEFNRDKIEEDRCIAVKGKLDKSRDKLSFLVSSVLELGKLRRRAAKLSETAAETSSAVPAGPSYRELHIRLNETAADREENLFPLRDYLYSASGPCSVFIHIPIPGDEAVKDTEAVIRTAAQITTSADASCIEALTLCAGVAEVWPE